MKVLQRTKAKWLIVFTQIGYQSNLMAGLDWFGDLRACVSIHFLWNTLIHSTEKDNSRQNKNVHIDKQEKQSKGQWAVWLAALRWARRHRPPSPHTWTALTDQATQSLQSLHWVSLWEKPSAMWPSQQRGHVEGNGQWEPKACCMISLQGGPLLVEPCTSSPLWEPLSLRHTTKLHPDSWASGYEIISVYCLKLLCFVVICYTEIDN